MEDEILASDENASSFVPYLNEERVLRFAMEMFSVVYNYNVDQEGALGLRVGMHCGQLVSGVIGILKFAFDVRRVIIFLFINPL